jgi:sigma-B regulation protein RsbU (phosphoserine phosphatase)
MLDSLIYHLRTLSNACRDEDEDDALRLLAVCLREVHGPSSFISLVPLPEPHRFAVRTVYQATADGGTVSHYPPSRPEVESPEVSALIADGQPSTHDRVPSAVEAVFASLIPGQQSLMVLPQFLDGKVQRWLFILGEQPAQFSALDMPETLILVNLATSYVARIAESRALQEANRWITQELDSIARLQRLLLPQDTSGIRGADIGVHFAACDRVGGDYYDLASLSRLADPDYPQDQPDIWGLIIADVSGHGAAAAVEVAMFDAILRTYRGSESAGSAGVFNYANEHLFTRMVRGSYLTAAILNYDPRSQTLMYANAGHPPPLLRLPGDNGIVELSQNLGIPLGVERNARWQNSTLHVPSGGLVLAYTDGVTEARSPQGEHFGLQRLRHVLRTTPGPAQALVDAVQRGVGLHQAGGRMRDDQTIIAVGIEPRET